MEHTMIKRRLRVGAGWLCVSLLAFCGTGAFAQGDIALAPDPGLSDRITDDSVSRQEEVRVQPKRLADYGISGLDNVIALKTLEPWDVVQLIEFLAYRGGINNIVVGRGVGGLTTKLKFENVTVGDALEVVLSVNRLAYEVRGGIITIMTDEEYQQLYGTSFYDNKQLGMVDLKYADAGRVSAMLEPVKSTIGTIVADPITGTLILIDTPEKIREMRKIVEKADISTVARVLPTETKPFVLQYASIEDLRTEVTSLLTPEIGAVRADRRTQTLIVTDLPHNMRKIEDLIEAFDEKQKQVFIEAKIVEVDLSDEFRLGINWDHFAQGIDPRFSVKSAVSPVVAGASGSLPAVGSVTYNRIIGDGTLNVILTALETVGDTRILSNPHVTVESDEEATINVVRDEPYAEAQLETGTTNVVGESIIFIEVGVKLSVTPRINDSGFIRMAIRPEVSTVVGTYAAFRSVPIVQKAYAETKVMIKNGETIIIAGMIRNEKRESESRVPVLGRIPLLGILFRAEDDTTRTTETIVFLTPRIIGGDEPVLLLKDMKKAPKPLRAIGASRKTLKPVR